MAYGDPYDPDVPFCRTDPMPKGAPWCMVKCVSDAVEGSFCCYQDGTVQKHLSTSCNNWLPSDIEKSFWPGFLRDSYDYCCEIDRMVRLRSSP